MDSRRAFHRAYHLRVRARSAARRSPRIPGSVGSARRAPSQPPTGRVPPQHVPRAPRARAVATVPNPRTPNLVNPVDGGGFVDLFALFPDLPRPRRPAPRLRARRKV